MYCWRRRNLTEDFTVIRAFNNQLPRQFSESQYSYLEPAKKLFIENVCVGWQYIGGRLLRGYLVNLIKVVHIETGLVYDLCFLCSCNVQNLT